MSIFDQVFHSFATDIGIPPVIYQHVFVAHCCSQVDVADLIVVIDAAILPQNPAPGATAHAIVVLRGVARLHHIPRNGSLDNRFQTFAHSNRAPGSAAGQGKAGSAVPLPLFSSGIGKAI